MRWWYFLQIWYWYFGNFHLIRTCVTLFGIGVVTLWNALFSVVLYLKSHWGCLLHNIWSYVKCVKDISHCRCLRGFWFSSCVFVCFVFTGFQTCCKNSPITGWSNPKVCYNRRSDSVVVLKWGHVRYLGGSDWNLVDYHSQHCIFVLLAKTLV